MQCLTMLLNFLAICTLYFPTRAKTTDSFLFDHLFGPSLGPPLSSLLPSQQNRLVRTRAPVYPGTTVTKLENDTAYACPFPYTYYSYEDAINYKMQNCGEFQSKSTYRILGGGSVSGCSKQCRIQPQDTQVLEKAVCVKFKTGYTSEILSSNGNCPFGSARLSYTEALSNLASCKYWHWPKTAIMRVGFLGSISRYNDDCEIKEFNPILVSSAACWTRSITDVKIIDSGEDVCGEGKTLLTPAEAYARLNAVCALLQPYETARLLGGGSIDGSAYGCQIRDTDRRPLKKALCADIRG